MSYIIKSMLLMSAICSFSSAALAHGGHLGELAGHSHWVGVAAFAGAALIAGIVAKVKKRPETGEETASEIESDGGTFPDGAEAELA